MRVVFSLPLEAIGATGGAEFSEVVALSGTGSYLTGMTRVLDCVQIGATRSEKRACT